MATQNTITLPRQYSTSKYCIPAVRKEYSGGNNVLTPFVTKFLDGGAGKIVGARVLPKSLDNASAIAAKVLCSLPASGSSGEKVRLTFAYHLAASTESKDPAAVTESVAQSVDVSTWSLKTLYVASFTLTQGDFAGEDHMDFYLERDATHADDNYANSVLVHEIYLLAYF